MPDLLHPDGQWVRHSCLTSQAQSHVRSLPVVRGVNNANAFTFPRQVVFSDVPLHNRHNNVAACGRDQHDAKFVTHA